MLSLYLKYHKFLNFSIFFFEWLEWQKDNKVVIVVLDKRQRVVPVELNRTEQVMVSFVIVYLIYFEIIFQIVLYNCENRIIVCNT